MIRFIEPVSPRRAQGRVGEVYGRVRRDLGLVAEPFLLLSPLPEMLAGSWCVLAETVLADGEVPRRDKEIVATAVSRANACPFCVETHSTFVAAGGDGATARRLRRGGDGRPADPRTAALVAWAESTGRAEAPLLAAPPFAAADAPELCGTAVGFHFINRMVTVFLGDSLLPPLAAPVRGPVLWLLARALRRSLRRPRPPGESLDLLPPAEAPPEMEWISGRPHLAGAFGRWWLAARNAAGGRLPEAARRRVEEVVDGWRGEAAPLGTAWLDEAAAGLDERSAVAARLGLLAALAPHRAGSAEVAAFRRHFAGDEPLLAATAWGAAQAARRVASWIAPRAAGWGEAAGVEDRGVAG